MQLVILRSGNPMTQVQPARKHTCTGIEKPPGKVTTEISNATHQSKTPFTDRWKITRGNLKMFGISFRRNEKLHPSTNGYESIPSASPATRCGRGTGRAMGFWNPSSSPIRSHRVAPGCRCAIIARLHGMAWWGPMGGPRYTVAYGVAEAHRACSFQQLIGSSSAWNRFQPFTQLMLRCFTRPASLQGSPLCFCCELGEIWFLVQLQSWC